MKKNIQNLQLVVFILAIISLIVIIGDSIIINFYTEEVVLDPDNISSWERLIIIGAILMGAFFLSSMYWVAQVEGDKGRFSPGKVFTMIFGLLCVFLLVGEKAMANRVGELIDSQMDIESMMVNIQMLFIIQLIYVVLIMAEIFAQNDAHPEAVIQRDRDLLHSRNVIAAVSSIIPGLGHIYKAHYASGIGIIVISPFFVLGGVFVGFATFGIGMFFPVLYMILIGWHAYEIEDKRKHAAGIF